MSAALPAALISSRTSWSLWAGRTTMEGHTGRSQIAWKGARYGMVGGLAVGQAIIASNSPLGFYTGSVVLGV